MEEPKKVAAEENLAETKEKKEVSEQHKQQQSRFSVGTWIYFLAFLVALGLTVALMSKDSTAEASPFSIPASLREHFASGKFIKVEVGDQRRSVRAFVIAKHQQASRLVLLLHGMGSSSFLYRKLMPLLTQAGVGVVALDFPGSGFSDKFTLEEWRQKPGGVRWLFRRAREVVAEILEKGPFWRLEQLFDTGILPEVSTASEIVHWPVGGDNDELAEAMGQVLDSLGVDQIHVVAHDTSSEAASSWCKRNPRRVLSVTLIDSAPSTPALPGTLVGSPGVGALLLSSGFVFSRVLKACCSGSISPEAAEAHAFLLRSGRGRAALMEMAMMVNSSSSLSDLWGWTEDASFPVQVLWSRRFSRDWSEEGDRVRESLPRAAFHLHSGSRWPQEDAAGEIGDAIVKLVLSLPPGRMKVVEETQHEDHHHHHHESQSFEDNGHAHQDQHHDHHHDHHLFGGYQAWGM